jgi:uncharacterized protein YijF (DUF1287 family)
MKKSAIEYVGAPPVRRKPRNPLGGWLLLIFSLGVCAVFLRPLIPFLQAQQDQTSRSNVTETVQILESEGTFADRLAAAALRRTMAKVAFDNSTYQIDFPGGDIPENKGNRADLIVRAYRGVGIDLQEEVHRDISSHFTVYPQIYGRKGPDANNDHRLVPNLDRFFSRKGEALANTTEELDYQVGDLVIWRLVDGSKHIGIVVPGPGAKQSEKWVVHNLNIGPVWENRLFDYNIHAHYRFEQ